MKTHVALLLGLFLLAIAHPGHSQAPVPPTAPAPGTSAPGAPAPAKDASASSNSVTLGNEAIYKASFAALTMLFVIAILLESAFALIFNWNVFRAFVSLRAIKPLIMLIGSWLVVSQFQVDVVSSLISIYKSSGASTITVGSTTLSRFLTALILAGGSAGVYNIMAALGFRNERESAPLVPNVGPKQAWLSIRVPGAAKQGRAITVTIRKLAAATAGDPAPLAGTIGADRPRLRDLFFRNPDHFPSTGGYTLDADHVYEISVTQGDVELLAPAKYVFAPRAVIDWEIALPG